MPQPSANYRNSGISTIIRPAAEVTKSITRLQYDQKTEIT